MKTTPERFYSKAPEPPQAKATPTPATEVEAFLAARGFHCELLAARITREQCERNQARRLPLCAGCAQGK